MCFGEIGLSWLLLIVDGVGGSAFRFQALVFADSCTIKYFELLCVVVLPTDLNWSIFGLGLRSQPVWVCFLPEGCSLPIQLFGYVVSGMLVSCSRLNCYCSNCCQHLY